MRKWIRRIWIALGLSFTAWMVWNLQAHGVPAAVTEPSAAVAVRDQGEAIDFVPAQPRASNVVVFLPGGLVAPRAYLPIVRALADEGIAAALVEMPYRSAVTEAQRRELWSRILAARDRLGPTSPLILAGHSRGAAMATRFAAEHPDAVAALILIGTTHPKDDDLSAAPYRVLKIVGTRDCVAPLEDSRANAAKLPARTDWVTIAGANHAQFGFYGTQLNDCRAEISRADQQQQLLAAMTRFITAH
jgi:pimeloyl-ACP methyl ester carboxylesterase